MLWLIRFGVFKLHFSSYALFYRGERNKIPGTQSFSIFGTGRYRTRRVLEKKFGTGRVPGSRQTLDARELARKTALKLLVTTSAESRKPFSPANDQRILQATVLHCILGPVRLLWNKALIGTISGEFKQRWSIAPIDQHIFQAVMLRCTLDWVKLPWKVSLKLLLAKYQHHFLINPCSDAVLHPGPS